MSRCPRNRPVPRTEHGWRAASSTATHRRRPQSRSRGEWTAVSSHLDSGSAVSLVQSTVVHPRRGTKACLSITCVHGDTRQVPARRVTITAASGSWPVEVGIIKDLPVPVLIGRDWPGFDRLLTAAMQSASRAGNRQKRRSHRRPRRRPILLARQHQRR